MLALVTPPPRSPRRGGSLSPFRFGLESHRDPFPLVAQVLGQLVQALRPAAAARSYSVAAKEVSASQHSRTLRSRASCRRACAVESIPVLELLCFFFWCPDGGMGIVCLAVTAFAAANVRAPVDYRSPCRTRTSRGLPDALFCCQNSPPRWWETFLFSFYMQTAGTSCW